MACASSVPWSAKALHQCISQRRKHQAQPVGKELVATGAGAEEIELRLLDAVLGLTALAVDTSIYAPSGSSADPFLVKYPG